MCLLSASCAFPTNVESCRANFSFFSTKIKPFSGTREGRKGPRREGNGRKVPGREARGQGVRKGPGEECRQLRKEGMGAARERRKGSA